MTQWMKNQPIPREIIAPTKLLKWGIETRPVNVTGIGTLTACPNCSRSGPIDVLTLGDGATWPNLVVVCGRAGDTGCGLYWCLAARPATRFTPD